jgi:hypothetical protein
MVVGEIIERRIGRIGGGVLRWRGRTLRDRAGERS